MNPEIINWIKNLSLYYSIPLTIIVWSLIFYILNHYCKKLIIYINYIIEKKKNKKRIK
jgi:hypothetical protein